MNYYKRILNADDVLCETCECYVKSGKMFEHKVFDEEHFHNLNEDDQQLFLQYRNKLEEHNKKQET